MVYDIESSNGGAKAHLWWEKDKERHAAVWAAAELLSQEQSFQREAALHYLRLYSNRQVFGLTGTDYQTSLETGERIKLNVVKSCIDTAVAQIGTNKPRPMHQTRKGDYKLRKRAERLDKFSLGQFHNLDIYDQGLCVFLDACIFGTGVLRFWTDCGKIKCERVMPFEIILDVNDAFYGEPRQIFIHKEVEKEVLKAEYPDYKVAIDGSGMLYDEGSRRQGISSACSVIESWRLPDDPDDDECFGLHSISIQNAELYAEEYSEADFPFAVFHWSLPQNGWSGIGAAEELSPIQVEINYIAQKIQKLMTLATSMVWLEKGSRVSPISNKDWATREYNGKPPIFQTTAAVSAEYFHHLDRLIARAYELVGISQLQAQSQKPAGLDSGEALRVYNDIGTRRFKHTAQRWEKWFLDVDKQILRCAREIADDDDAEELEILTAGDKDIEKIKWSDVAIDEVDYITKTWPVSLLPEEPAGKVQRLQELAQVSDELKPHLVRLMAGHPDMDAIIERITAPEEIIDSMIGGILDDGFYEPPWPQMDLKLARKMATEALMRARIDKVEESKMEMLRMWIGDIDDMQAMAEEEAMAQMQMQAAAAEVPPAAPGPSLAGPAVGPTQLPQ